MAATRSFKTHSLRVPRAGSMNEVITFCGMKGAQEKISAEFLTEDGAMFRVSGGEPSCRKCMQQLGLLRYRTGRPRVIRSAQQIAKQ